ncbi:hypothetical protein HJC23_009731 [Cyclotella cryptica]|uniref:Aminoglycoside phosphotransferase domain-containing protein n=1 Tax=Cyclotella cryptica TaxID=29204 RepID=A0ABD3PTG6_9STRA|eukprot:CCRYP_012863-RA/>CCRYP_012863-RA protein AED:0.08 eAED:0.08 QI:0/-1/0/1/-1/1/1/0/444
MTIAQIDSVTAPTDVTPALLSCILQCKVSSCQLNALGRGVMSNVQLLTVCYDVREQDSSSMDAVQLPTQFLVKFKKAEVPLPDLFSVEGEFYKLSESLSVESENRCDKNDPVDATFPFSFRIVKAMATGPSWLLLEFIPPSVTDTFDVHQGCPENVFDDLLLRLARMHSFFWMHGQGESTMKESQQKKLALILKNHCHNLSSSPGAGHTLPINSRQEQFVPAWPAVRERLTRYIKSEDLQKMDNLVEMTAADSRIKKCATRVTERKYTIVHGDFHIGNILLPKGQQTTVDRCEESHIPWLVDWSMVGLGNPLIDLVFFLVVGANDISIHQTDSSSTSKNVERILKLYHTILNEQKIREISTDEPNNISTQQRLLLSWDEFVSMFRECLLNQFIILVCYDSLCRDMSDACPCGEKDVYHDHFDRVNVRCLRMLLSDYGWMENMFD